MKNYLIILLFLLSSCSFFGSQDKEDALAKVYGNILYPTDLLGPEFDNEDSAFINPALIDIWISQQLWYEKAKNSDINIDIEQQLEDYKKSLYIAAYQESILEKANIQIDDAAILAYYKNNKSQFVVNEDLFKIQYYILPDNQNLDTIMLSLNDENSNTWLQNYCLTYSTKCLTNATWVGKSVLEDLSIPNVFWTTSAKFQSYYKSDNTVCVFRIIEKRQEGETAPLAQVKEEILLLLKHQKEKELLQEEENTLLFNAQNKDKIEKY